MNKNYYDILEIPTNAKKDEIKSAFRNMARKYHPDVNHTVEAEILFKQVNLAAKTLLDDNMRFQYDFAYGFNQKRTQEQKEQSAQNARQTYKKASEDYKTYSDFAKNFGEFFTKREKEKNKKKTEANLKKINGDDITSDVTISIKEALEGTTRKVNILQSEKCPKCFGAKFINGTKCTFCDGKGEKISYKKINIKIPPNIKDGIKIRVRGQGEEGKNGGDNGDLYLIVHIAKNNIFKDNNGEAFLEVPITPAEAVCGADIKIPTPSGGFKMLKIPPKTRTNTIFKLLDCGFLSASTGNCGILLVKVVIDISSCLSDKEVELYRMLDEIGKCAKTDIREDYFKNYGHK